MTLTHLAKMPAALSNADFSQVFQELEKDNRLSFLSRLGDGVAEVGGKPLPSFNRQASGPVPLSIPGVF